MHQLSSSRWDDGCFCCRFSRNSSMGVWPPPKPCLVPGLRHMSSWSWTLVQKWDPGCSLKWLVSCFHQWNIWFNSICLIWLVQCQVDRLFWLFHQCFPTCWARRAPRGVVKMEHLGVHPRWLACLGQILIWWMENHGWYINRTWMEYRYWYWCDINNQIMDGISILISIIHPS